MNHTLSQLFGRDLITVIQLVIIVKYGLPFSHIDNLETMNFENKEWALTVTRILNKKGPIKIGPRLVLSSISPTFFNIFT